MAENENDVASIFGRLDIHLGKLVDFASKRDRRMDKLEQASRRAESPKFIKFRATGTVPVSGFLVLSYDLPGPSQGWFWNIKRLSISGITPGTTVGGRADVFISASDLRYVSDFSFGMSDWVDQASSLPLVGNYGDGELLLHNPEKLYVIVSEGTGDDIIVSNGVAMQVQEAAYEFQYEV